MRHSKKFAPGLAMMALVGMMCFLPSAAQAQVIFNFDSVFTGDTPAGSTPWARLTLTNDGVNKVNGVLENLMTGTNQFIGLLELNLFPFPAGLSATWDEPPIDDITFSEDGFTDAGEKFDVKVDFLTSAANRLNPGNSASFSIMGTGLTADYFKAFATPNGQNPANVYALLHIQGIDLGEEEGSSKVTPSLGDPPPVDPVPEPSSLAVLGSSMVGSLGYLLRRRRQNKLKDED